MQGKPEDLKTFRNTVLGETWLDRGDAPDWERLVERREDFRLGVVAQDALVLTAGVDVQDDLLECDVCAWAERHSSCLMDHIVIAGSLRERARASEGLSARIYVVCPADAPARVIGYLSISTALE